MGDRGSSFEVCLAHRRSVQARMLIFLERNFFLQDELDALLATEPVKSMAAF
jgi:hypothetical protein